MLSADTLPQATPSA
ncbi:hypothetical protein [Pseudomonas syringae]